MQRGYIKLYRCIKDNELWNDESFTRGQAWVDLLIIANHKEGIIRRRGIRITVKRGEVGMSLRELSDRWKWSIGKIQRFFDQLKNDTQIHYRTDTENVNVTNLICITNYEVYQKNDTETDTETDTATDTETIRKQVQNKNVKNVKKENKVFIPPSILEVDAYMKEIGYDGSANNFVDSNTAKGWVIGKLKTPAKDWKAMVRTWHGNEKKNNPEQEPLLIQKDPLADQRKAVLDKYEY